MLSEGKPQSWSDIRGKFDPSRPCRDAVSWRRQPGPRMNTRHTHNSLARFPPPTPFRCRCSLSRRLAFDCNKRAPRESLLQSALEHLDLILQEQAMRKGYSAQTAWLLYADVCLSLGEASAVAKSWAKGAYQEVRRRKQRRARKDTCSAPFVGSRQ